MLGLRPARRRGGTPRTAPSVSSLRRGSAATRDQGRRVGPAERRGRPAGCGRLDHRWFARLNVTRNGPPRRRRARLRSRHGTRLGGTSPVAP